MGVDSKFASSPQDNTTQYNSYDNFAYDGDTDAEFDNIEPESATEEDGESDLEADADRKDSEDDKYHS